MWPTTICCASMRLVGYGSTGRARTFYRVMRNISSRMPVHGLSRLRCEPLASITGNAREEINPVVKYQGLSVDSFRSERWLADCAALGVTSLSRLISNVRGPRSIKRRLLMTAFGQRSYMLQKCE